MKKHPVLASLAVLLAAVVCTLVWKQFVYLEGSYMPAEDTSESFRVAAARSNIESPVIKNDWVNEAAALFFFESGKVFLAICHQVTV